MSDSPLRALVHRTLRPIERRPSMFDSSELTLALFDGAARAGAEAVAGSGVGLDHLAGERVLASVLWRDTPKGNEHRIAVALTDRRTVVSGWSSIAGPLTLNGTRGAVAHADLVGVDVKDSVLSRKLVLKGPSGTLDVTVAEAVPALGAFYRALGAVPVEARAEPATPFVQATDGDPTGAATTAGALWSDDPEARSMLAQLARAAAEGGLAAAAGRDFVGRVVLAHRIRLGGPGMRDDRWMSPMSAHDLGHTLVRIFGAPTSHQQPQPGVEMLDFRLDPRRDLVGAAMSTLGVASSIATGFGLSPGKAIAGALMRRREVTGLRVLFADQPGFSAFRLQGHGVPLERMDSRLAHRVHQVLGAAAYPVLARRAVLGWGASYDELWG